MFQTVLLLAQYVALATAPSPVLFENVPANMSAHILVLEDPEGTLSHYEALDQLMDGKFRSTGQASPSLGFTSGVVWFGARVQNHARINQFVIELGYPLLDDVRFYHQTSKAFLGPVQSGDLFHFGNRHRALRNFNFKMQLKAGDNAVLLFRVRSQSSMQLPLVIHSEASIGDAAVTENMGLGFYFGILFVVLIYNAFFWAIKPDHLHGLYCGYLAGFLVFQLCMVGVAFQYFYKGAPIINEVIVPASLFTALTCAQMFCTGFLSLRTMAPRLHQLLIKLSWASGAMALLSFVVPYSIAASCAVVWAGVMSFLLGAVGFVGLKRKSVAAKYYLFAWGIFLVSVVVKAAAHMGLISTGLLTEYGVYVGSAVEMIFLSLGLAKRQETDQDRIIDNNNRLRGALETRFLMVSDLSHRLNNPLNYIGGGVTVIADELRLHEQELNALLPQDDPAAEPVRKAFESRFARMRLAAADMKRGCHLSAECVDEIRSLSGVDGYGLERLSLEEIFNQTKKRILGNYGTATLQRLKIESMDHEPLETLVATNRYALAMGFELAISLGMTELHEGQQLKARFYQGENGVADRTRLMMSLECEGNAIKVDTDVVQTINHLLEPYSAKVGESGADARLVFEIPNAMFNDEVSLEAPQ